MFPSSKTFPVWHGPYISSPTGTLIPRHPYYTSFGSSSGAHTHFNTRAVPDPQTRVEENMKHMKLFRWAVKNIGVTVLGNPGFHIQKYPSLDSPSRVCNLAKQAPEPRGYSLANKTFLTTQARHWTDICRTPGFCIVDLPVCWGGWCFPTVLVAPLVRTFFFPFRELLRWTSLTECGSVSVCCVGGSFEQEAFKSTINLLVRWM